MDTMDKAYVENRDGGYWIKGTRISLDSIVYAFHVFGSVTTHHGSCVTSISCRLFP